MRALVLLALVACDCHPTGATLPTDSAPPVSDACVSACAAMAAAGCSEGRASTCPGAMQRINDDRLIVDPAGVPVACTPCSVARTPAQVAALCGSSCTP